MTIASHLGNLLGLGLAQPTSHAGLRVCSFRRALCLQLLALEVTEQRVAFSPMWEPADRATAEAQLSLECMRNALGGPRAPGDQHTT